MGWNEDLDWYTTGEVVDGSPDGSTSDGALNRPPSQLLENDIYLKGVIENEHNEDGSHKPITQLSLGHFSQVGISTNRITITSSNHTIVATANSLLQWIDGGEEDRFLILRLHSDAYTVTIQHDVGNILTTTGNHIVLSNTRQFVILYYDGSDWRAQDATGGNVTGLELSLVTSGSTTVSANSASYITLTGQSGGVHRLYQVSAYCSSPASLPVFPTAGSVLNPANDSVMDAVIASVRQFGSGQTDELVISNFSTQSATVQYSVYVWS